MEQISVHIAFTLIVDCLTDRILTFPTEQDMTPGLLPQPSMSEICSWTELVFGCRPCLWQIKVVETILRHDHDVILIAGTGMGKTLTFWMPLLFRKGGLQIITTPLNILGKQNV